jgi:hypothetical protein
MTQTQTQTKGRFWYSWYGSGTNVYTTFPFKTWKGKEPTPTIQTHKSRVLFGYKKEAGVGCPTMRGPHPYSISTVGPLKKQGKVVKYSIQFNSRFHKAQQWRQS